MRIAILGSGPAGLIAAHNLLGKYGLKHEIDIITESKAPSVIRGAQFLHRSIFDDQPPTGRIDFMKLGTMEGYANKVYGSPYVPTSWTEHRRIMPFWSLKEQYDSLWSAWKRQIKVERIDVLTFEKIVASGMYSCIFSSIPAYYICKRPDIHWFPKSSISLFKTKFDITDNVIIYNGRAEDDWYRLSRIQGEAWAEFGSKWENADYLPTVTQERTTKFVKGYKPLGTNCDCWKEYDVHRIGRFGQWDRKVLLHHVPAQVRRVFD